jgi:hypothetical protein
MCNGWNWVGRYCLEYCIRFAPCFLCYEVPDEFAARSGISVRQWNLDGFVQLVLFSFFWIKPLMSTATTPLGWSVKT